MAGVSGLLILISVITGTASFIALIRPLPGLWLPTRKRAFVIWVVSLLLLSAGTSENEGESQTITGAAVEVPVPNMATTAEEPVKKPVEAPAPKLEPVPKPEPKPVPKSKSKWIAQPYTLVEDKDVSSSIRTRRRLRIVAPAASTSESQIATLMQAAIELHRKNYPQFIAAWLMPFEEAPGAMAIINYAPDGCGISGLENDCTGEMWTDAKVSSEVLTPAQLSLGKAWEKHRGRFKDADGLIDEARLYKFLAEQRNSDVDSLQAEMLGFITATIPTKRIVLPAGLKTMGSALTPKEQARSEEAACRADLQCWGDKHSMRATISCQGVIEALARYDYEWTDGWLGTKFDRFGWKKRSAGTLVYRGSEIKFQNGFGAWSKVTYWCDYDPNTQTVLDVRIQ